MRKRIDIVSLKAFKEHSIFYEPRFIMQSKDCAQLLKPFLENQAREEFIVIALNPKNEPTAIEICSKGTADTSLVHPREIFKLAIISNATKIIIAHNHPSGSVEPSQKDINITKQLVMSSTILGIPILDHIIIGNEDYFSFADKNLL